MIIDLEKFCKKFRIRVKGVIHVGAHWGQEYNVYKAIGAKKVIFIEPCAEAFHKLFRKFRNHADVTLVNTACGNYTGQVMMNVSPDNQGQSNSILEPKEHLVQHPTIKFNGTEIVNITTLDSIEFDRDEYDMLSMDIQGYELEVLKGAENTLPYIDLIMTEVNRRELYEKCARLKDVENFLRTKFNKVELKMEKYGWGDAIFRRKNNA